MITEQDICKLTALLHAAGCSDVALAMEMALFDDAPTIDEALGEGNSANPGEPAVTDMVIGSLGLSIPKISLEQKAEYRALASKLIVNSDPAVRRAARRLLKAVP